MTRVERVGAIAARYDEVWATLADFASISRWAPNVDHSCLLTEAADGVGMVRRIQTGRTTITERVVRWVPESELAYAIEGLPPVIISVENAWRLVPAGAYTEATLTTTIATGPRPPQQAIGKAVGRRLAAASDAMLTGLARHHLATAAPDGQILAGGSR